MSSQVYVNGEFLPKDEAKISVFDHGALYGDGVFEGIRAYGGRVFRLEQHLDRLYQGAHTIMLEVPLTREEMAEKVCEACRLNEIRDGYIRLLVTRGVGDLGLDPRKCSEPGVIIIAADIALYPERYYTEGLALITCATRRMSPEALDPGLKSLNYLNNIMAKLETIEADVPEGIMLSPNGYVAECTGDNIFVYDEGCILTPPVHIGALDGITRRAIMEIAQGEDIPVKQELFGLRTLYNADEVFLTGTAAEVVPVVRIDGRTISDGKPGGMTNRLRSRFQELTGSEGTPIWDE